MEAGVGMMTSKGVTAKFTRCAVPEELVRDERLWEPEVVM